MSGSGDELAGDADRVLVGVEDDVADLDRRRAELAGAVARRPPQHGAHPGDQLAQAVRLGDVVVGTDLEADDRVDLGALGGHHDDRHLAALAELPAHVDAADPRQHHVEQHEVGLDDVETVERLEAVGGDLDSEAFTLQADA